MPPRKRKIESQYNIPYVHITKGRIEYRPYIKAGDRHPGIIIDKGGFLKPPIKLGMDGDDPDAIFKAYLAAKQQMKQEAAYRSCTLGWIFQAYQNSKRYRELAPKTQERNINLSKIFDMTLEINGKPSPLAELHITSINKPLIQSIALEREAEYQHNNKKGSVQVNREITLISSCISWGVDYLPELAEIGIHQNPLKGLKKLAEPKNERYVTDTEYWLQYKHSSKYDYLQPIYELTYLTACRGAETLDIKLSDCTEEGIYINRRKNSKDNIIEWSPRLREAYKAALKLHKTRTITDIDPYLVPGFSGGKLKAETMRTAMQRIKKNMKADGFEKEYWSLHLLKSKGMSDSDDKKIAGHKTEAMRNLYDTKVSSHKAVK